MSAAAEGGVLLNLSLISILLSRSSALAFSNQRRCHFLSRKTRREHYVNVAVVGGGPPTSSLPRRPVAVAVAARDAPGVENPVRPPGGRWILVVEDEGNLRSAVGEFLAEVGGHYVTGVADARSALAVCRGVVAPDFLRRKHDFGKNSTDAPKELGGHRDVPDCIVLDIRLGSIDGLELLKIIRSDPSLESLPVVLLTAKGRLEDRTLGYEAGADAYLAKPFEHFELLSIVNGLLMPDPTQINTNTYEDLKRELMEIKEIFQEEKSSDPAPCDSAEEGSVDSLYHDLAEIKEMLRRDVKKKQKAHPKLIKLDSSQISLMSVLTPEEVSIINLVSQGMTNNNVAIEMQCSASKIEKHITSMFKKANVSKRADLISWWGKYSQNKERKLDDGNDESDLLSTKEKAMLDYLANGMATDEILSKNKLAKSQMVRLVDNLLKKAGVETKTDLVRWWIEIREEAM